MPQVIVGWLHCQALVYRTGRKNNDADVLSRLHSFNKETLFNEVKVICHATLVSAEEAFALYCNKMQLQNASLDEDEAGTHTGSDFSQTDWPTVQTVDWCHLLCQAVIALGTYADQATDRH